MSPAHPPALCANSAGFDMARPDLPSRSSSELMGPPPADASKSDVDAVEDVYERVEETGSLEAAARKLQQYARTRGFQNDPEEAAYRSQNRGDNEEEGEEVQEVVHLQEVVEGLWIGDLVAAMDTEGLQQRGIASRSARRASGRLLIRR